MFGLRAPRDERQAHRDQAADRFAYLAISYLALGLVAWRSVVDRSASWDLLALVVAGGIAGAAFRIRAGVVTVPWLRAAALTILAGAVVAALAATAGR